MCAIKCLHVIPVSYLLELITIGGADDITATANTFSIQRVNLRVHLIGNRGRNLTAKDCKNRDELENISDLGLHQAIDKMNILGRFDHRLFLENSSPERSMR
uniref:Uncharacterized protein n=1 Tax=Spongospora subterranea TaxID=70186 RepID=A0A0H5R6Z3_9EUKA|eukprot:CRZ04069.1 hypothetical protein [Spongospora subterranea]